MVEVAKPEPEPEQDDNTWQKPDLPDSDVVEAMRPPGLIEQIMEYNLSTAMYPQPLMALAGAIALMGVITGRRIRDQRNTRTNVYLIVLAPSGCGKDQSRSVNKNILLAAKWNVAIGGDRITSHAGIVSALAHYPAKLFQPDEFHATMQSATRGRNNVHLQHIPEVLKECYSEAGTVWLPASYGDRKKNITITQPHAVLHASGVPAPFWDAMTVELASSGFLGRTLVIETGFDVVMPHDIVAAGPPESLVEQVAWWKTVERGGTNIWTEDPQPIVVTETPEAHERLFNHLQEIRQKQQNEDHIRGAIWGRSGQKAAQLALLFAASRHTGMLDITIDLQDVDRAITLANWSTRLLVQRCIDSVADSEHQKRIQKILAAIGRNWTSLSEITRRTQGVCDRMARKNILQDLEQAEQIETRIKSTGGRHLSEFRKCNIPFFNGKKPNVQDPESETD